MGYKVSSQLAPGMKGSPPAPSHERTTMDTATEIGRRIARARKDKGISQEDLARSVGVRAGRLPCPLDVRSDLLT